jgi:hypothetical protein
MFLDSVSDEKHLNLLSQGQILDATLVLCSKVRIWSHTKQPMSQNLLDADTLAAEGLCSACDPPGSWTRPRCLPRLRRPWIILGWVILERYFSLLWNGCREIHHCKSFEFNRQVKNYLQDGLPAWCKGCSLPARCQFW